MKCSRCHFENIPGQERCLKCGSVLEAGGAVADIHPPRMRVGGGVIRGLARWFRGRRRVRKKSPDGNIRPRLTKVASDGLVGLVISVIPGLAHLINGRFREVRWHVLLWFVVLSSGLFLFGSQAGSLLIGLAIGLHAWIGIKFGLFREIVGLVERVVIVLVLVLLLTSLYWAAPRVAFRGYTGGYTTLTIPDLNVSAGDYLLVRRIAQPADQLARGTLVLFRPPRFRNTRQDLLGGQQGLMVGQIVGLPGETVEIRDVSFAVEGQVLDRNRYPVPHWLEGRNRSVYVKADSYFISTEYTAHGRARNLIDRIMGEVCVVESEGVHGRAFMRWLPLARRGFFE
jgi:type IV secretory pathway protease TraF